MYIVGLTKLINKNEFGEVEMKKSSAFVMVVPGLVILVVCLFLPLLKVLVPTLFAGEYPLSSYVDFFLDEYYLKIFARTVKAVSYTHLFP